MPPFMYRMGVNEKDAADVLADSRERNPAEGRLPSARLLSISLVQGRQVLGLAGRVYGGVEVEALNIRCHHHVDSRVEGPDIRDLLIP